jgi:hypothetical protein
MIQICEIDARLRFLWAAVSIVAILLPLIIVKRGAARFLFDFGQADLPPFSQLGVVHFNFDVALIPAEPTHCPQAAASTLYKGQLIQMYVKEKENK